MALHIFSSRNSAASSPGMEPRATPGSLDRGRAPSPAVRKMRDPDSWSEPSEPLSAHPTLPPLGEGAERGWLDRHGPDLAPLHPCLRHPRDMEENLALRGVEEAPVSHPAGVGGFDSLGRPCVQQPRDPPP
eukprot:CAMPEP_0180118682 /NCGR_PEP_ID=MMETSP0986-20121125/1581_1 /TAXON_ID=697907 /ORGANISM="non described non described, Strain CCMP2293" /LENGTH=130 /DNA_ID=CAMNT_0022057637 /DNA_START=210 /DNA_END=599 /DNA_ORIENTATION=+